MKRKSIRGAVFFASSSAFDVVLRILTIAILARLLLPEDFGLVAMVAAITGVVDSFRDLGLSAATVQRQDITHAQVSNLFWINVVVGLGFAATFSVASPFVAEFYGDSRLVGVTVALSLVFIWSGLTVQHEALMSRQLRQGELALIRSLANVVSAVAAVWLALSDWSYWALIWREVIRSVLIAGGVWLRCPWMPGAPGQWAGTGGLVRFGVELSATNLITGLISNIDKILIGRVFGAAPVGMFRQAQQLTLAPIDQLKGSIISVAQPALSALQADPPRYRRYYEKVVFLVTVATVPVGLFVTVYAEQVTLLLLGSKWQEAAVFVRVFGLLAMIQPAVGTSVIVLITCGLSRRFLTLAIIHGVLLTILVIAGIRWGPEGVAWAHLATALSLMVPKLYYSFVDTPATLAGFFRSIRPSVIAGLTMAFGLVVLQIMMPDKGALLSLLIGASVGGPLYLLALWVQPDSRAELKLLPKDLQAAMRSRRGKVAADGS